MRCLITWLVLLLAGVIPTERWAVVPVPCHDEDGCHAAAVMAAASERVEISSPTGDTCPCSDCDSHGCACACLCHVPVLAATTDTLAFTLDPRGAALGAWCAGPLEGFVTLPERPPMAGV